MEKKEKITELIEDTLIAVPRKDTIKAPPFFKEKVLNQMQQQKEPKGKVWEFGWFTPRYQMATLLGFVILNSFVLLKSNTTNDYDQNLENFAEVYGITSEGIDSNY